MKQLVFFQRGRPSASRWRKGCLTAPPFTRLAARAGRLAAKAAIFLLLLLAASGARAQVPGVGIITGLVSKVIKAIDLKIQRIQTETIGLQEAQKEAENILSKLRLDEIRDWVQRQKDLYADYFEELRKVKQVLADYQKVTAILERQKQILAAYQHGLALFRQDGHFRPEELAQIEGVFGGILSESEKNLDRLAKLIESYATQMTDGARMEGIDKVAAGMDKNYRDLQIYSNEQSKLSLQRAGDEREVEFLKKLYGL